LACPDNAGVLAQRPVPPDLDARLERLFAAWKDDAEIAAVYLFGSRAHGGATPRSDVDLAVVLSAKLDGRARFRKRLSLLGEACTQLGTEAVDLVVLGDGPSVLGHRVLRGRLVAESDPRRRVEVAEDVLRRYLDERRLRDELDDALSTRVREGRFAR
jgi:predicted nucleotidyltransferase